MKRCSIIIHSVSGNCYIIGSSLKEELEKLNVEVKFYRVDDPDLHIWANSSESTNAFYEDILALPLATPEKLIKSDLVIFGCPTRFGNVSAEMKAFMDSTFELSENHALADKFFACFTSCSHTICDGAHALDAMIWWSQNMGMFHIPYGVRADVPTSHHPATGIVHLEGKESLVRPSIHMEEELSYYANNLASYIQE